MPDIDDIVIVCFQELSRLLRANNRLQKIVVRNGGLDLLSESTEIYEVPVSAQNNSLTSFTPGGTNAHDREQSLRKSFSHFDESLRMQVGPLGFVSLRIYGHS
jgi:hypothetical protein